MPLLRFTFEMFLGGAWVDITTSVRHKTFKVQIGTTDESPKLTPAKATLVLHNNDDRFNPDNPTGPYYGQLLRNTPIRISCAGGVSDASRFYGEVFAFVPQWNENRSDCTVPIEASGALRRIVNDDSDADSYYRSWANHHTGAPNLKYYWPLEEGSGADGGVAEIGATGAWFKNPPADGAGWGKAPMNDWQPNGVAIDNLNELHFPCDMRGSTSGDWEVAMWLTFSDDAVLCTGSIDCGPVQFIWAMTTDKLTDPNNPLGKLDVYTNAPEGFSLVSVPFTKPPLKDIGPIWLCFRSWFSGTTITTYVSWETVARESGNVNVTTISTRTQPAMLYPREIAVGCAVDLINTGAKGYVGLSSLSIGDGVPHGTAGMTTSYVATKAGVSEQTYDRFSRLCANAGLLSSQSAVGATTMGRQYNEKLETHFLEILAAGKHSGIIEARDTGRLMLLGVGTDQGTFDYSDIIPGLMPVVDDQLTVNRLQVNNSHAATARLSKDTGTMSIAQIGPFDGKWDTNNRKMQHAVSVAGTRLALGTWPGPRFREIRFSARARPALYSRLRAIQVGDFFTITGMASAGFHDDIMVKVLQITEVGSHEDHVFTFTVKPGEIDGRLWESYDGLNDGLMDDYVDIEDSTVAVASSGSTVDVNVPTAKWTHASGNYDIMISGERMTVTAVATLTSTTQRLTVTRSINGVVKTVPVGATVHMYPAYFIKAV